MTLTATPSRIDYTGTGATATYSFPFRIFQDADLEVTQADDLGNETTLTMTTDYTVTGAGSYSGGSITLIAGNLPADYTITIRSAVPLSQPTSIRNQAAFYASTHEDVFDRLTRIDQQQDEVLDRCFKLAVSDGGTDPTLPAAQEGYVLGWVGGVLRNLSAATAQLASDLLSSALGKGAELVNYLAPRLGAVLRSLYDKAQDSVSVFDFMTEAQRSDVRAGTALIDVTGAIQAALDTVQTQSGAFDIRTEYRGGRILLPAGVYRMIGGVTGLPGTTIEGAGSNATVLLHEGATGHVIDFTGTDAGALDKVTLIGFAVAQKTGVAHTGGDAIHIDGNGFGTTVTMRDVFTYGTEGGIYMDWCFPNHLDRVDAFVHVNGFKTRLDCTSTTFQNCYAGACTGSGFKIAGHYMSLVGCASDSNALDGYEFYYDGGASTGLAMVGCGAEAYGRNGISEDRVGSLSIVSPRMITGTSGTSCIHLDAGDAITILSPVLSGQAVNANPCINIVNTSGAYPTNVQIFGWSGAPTNYATAISQPDYVFWPGSRTSSGMYRDNLRLGGIGAFNRDLQVFQLGSNFPAGVGGTAYATNHVPVETLGHTVAATAHYKPVINAPALTIARFIAGGFVEAPTVTAGTVARHEGYRIADQPAGSSADANLVLGDATVPVGRWSIFNGSTRLNLFAAGIQWGTSSGAKDLFGTGTPEGAVTADVGSTFRRTDGGAGTSFYVKETGTGNTGWVGK